MNLADAIRKASQEPVPFSPTAQQAAVAWSDQPVAQVPVSQETESDAPVPTESQEASMSQSQPNEHTDPVAVPSTAVRLEMFLTPEQLSSLFRAVAANQHTLLTAREAASYLRISANSLEARAADGEIPGFLVDGRWRFSKQAIDEWLTQQNHHKEAA